MTGSYFDAKNVDEAAVLGSERLVNYLKMLGLKTDKLSEIELREFLREWLRGFAKTSRVAWANGGGDE
jgi:hypothetical protein